MALSRFVVTSKVTVAADIAGTVVGGESGTGAPAGPGNSASVSPTTAGKHGLTIS